MVRGSEVPPNFYCTCVGLVWVCCLRANLFVGGTILNANGGFASAVVHNVEYDVRVIL